MRDPIKDSRAGIPIHEKPSYTFWKCWKCGESISHGEYPGICTAPFALRTSGICGGGFKEITKEEYSETLESWRND